MRRVEVLPAWEFFSLEERKVSLEVDFGVHWEVGGQSWPRWRVSWIEGTGELYAIPLIPPDYSMAVWRKDNRPVVILGTFKDRESVEAAMAGWSERLYRPLADFFPEVERPEIRARISELMRMALGQVAPPTGSRGGQG